MRRSDVGVRGAFMLGLGTVLAACGGASFDAEAAADAVRVQYPVATEAEIADLVNRAADVCAGPDRTFETYVARQLDPVEPENPAVRAGCRDRYESVEAEMEEPGGG